MDDSKKEESSIKEEDHTDTNPEVSEMADSIKEPGFKANENDHTDTNSEVSEMADSVNEPYFKKIEKDHTDTNPEVSDRVSKASDPEISKRDDEASDLATKKALKVFTTILSSTLKLKVNEKDHTDTNPKVPDGGNKVLEIATNVSCTSKPCPAISFSSLPSTTGVGKGNVSSNELLLPSENIVKKISQMNRAMSARLIATTIRDVFTEDFFRKRRNKIPPKNKASASREFEYFNFPQMCEATTYNSAANITNPALPERELQYFKNTGNQKVYESECKNRRKRLLSEEGNSSEAAVLSTSQESIRSAKRQCDSLFFETLTAPLSPIREARMDIEEIKGSTLKQIENLQKSCSTIGQHEKNPGVSRGKLHPSPQKINDAPAIQSSVELKMSHRQISKLYPIVSCVARLTKPQKRKTQDLWDNSELSENEFMKSSNLKAKIPVTSIETKNIQVAEIDVRKNDTEIAIDASKSNVSKNQTPPILETSMENILTKNIWGLEQSDSISMQIPIFKKSEHKSTDFNYDLGDVYSEDRNTTVTPNKDTQRSLSVLLEITLQQLVDVPSTLLDVITNSYPWKHSDTPFFYELIRLQHTILCPLKSGNDSEYKKFERIESDFIYLSENDLDVYPGFKIVVNDLTLQMKMLSDCNRELISLSLDEALDSIEDPLTAEKLRRILKFIWVEANQNLYNLKSSVAKFVHWFETSEALALNHYLSLKKQVLDFKSQNELTETRIKNIMKRFKFVSSNLVHAELERLSFKVKNIELFYSELLGELGDLQKQFDSNLSATREKEKSV